MAQLTTAINPLIFPFEVDTITISASEAFLIKITLLDAVILEGTLTPDKQGICQLPNMAQLILDHIPTDNNGEWLTIYPFTIELDGIVAASVNLIPCRVQLDEAAVDFINQSFLTPCGYRKRTHMEATEYLFVAYNPDQPRGDYGIIESLWVDSETHECVTQEQPLQLGTTVVYDDHDVAQLDVSPRMITSPRPGSFLELKSYEVYEGGRKQTYLLFPDEAHMNHVTDFTFVNGFGVQDTFHCFGTRLKNTKVDYKKALVHGSFQNYQIATVPSWKVTTGPMLDEESTLLEDFVSSFSAETAEGIPVIITDCELKSSDDWAATNEGSITYREAKELRHNRIARFAQTFDNTFDNSFE